MTTARHLRDEIASTPERNLKLVYSSDKNTLEINQFESIIKASGRMLLWSDIMAMILAFAVGGLGAWVVNVLMFGDSFQRILSVETTVQFAVFICLGAMALLWLDSCGHYRQRIPYWEAVRNILTVAFIGFVVCGFAQFVAKQSFSRLWLGFSWTLFAGFLFAGRGLVRRYLHQRGRWNIPALMIGEGPLAQAAMQALKKDPYMGFQIVKSLPTRQLTQLAEPNAWVRLMRNCGGCHVFLAIEGSELERQRPALKAMVRERIPCSIVPPWMDLPTCSLSPHHFLMQDVLLLHDTNRLRLPLPRMLKRGFDLVCAGTALLLVLPLFIPIAFLIRMDGGPAIFRQERVGKGGKRFLCYKFRSMCVNADEVFEEYLAQNPQAAEEWHTFQKLKKDVRVTKIGSFIRRTSLDEIPQLINVIKGDMSLVGPRPIMPDQQIFYGDDFIFYESVRPGITGPWQVSGRNQLTFDERVKLECYYTKNWSLWMDVVIILKTVPALLSKEQAF